MLNRQLGWQKRVSPGTHVGGTEAPPRVGREAGKLAGEHRTKQLKQPFSPLSRYLYHMKQFLRIFCLYLFALSCLPCSDGEHGHEAAPGNREAAMLTENHDSPTHEHCADFCSPLCTCACCGCTTSSPRLATFQLRQPVFASGRTGFSYQSPFSTVHRSALFRPPISTLG